MEVELDIEPKFCWFLEGDPRLVGQRDQPRRHAVLSSPKPIVETTTHCSATADLPSPGVASSGTTALATPGWHSPI
jgi:hypothetical protein